MSNWTPSIKYQTGDIVTGRPGPAHFTAAERLAFAVAGLLLAAISAFGIIHVAPNRDIFPHNEIVGTVGLYTAAALFAVGVWLIADWRRKRRERAPFELFSSLISDARPVPIGELSEADLVRISRTKSSSDYHLDDINEDGSLKARGLMYPDSKLGKPVRAYADTFSAVPVIKQMMEGRPNPQADLQRHLTDALAVLLREPSLKIDASTLRMLAKHKERRPAVRDEKGRWRSVQ